MTVSILSKTTANPKEPKIIKFNIWIFSVNYNYYYSYYYNNFNYKNIAGVDEAGRGPLVGSVVAAAVILPYEVITKNLIPNLTDSKKLSEHRREQVYNNILEYADSYAIAEASALEIDQINIHQASLLAMQRAILSLSVKPDCVLIDGKFVPKDITNIHNIESKAIIKGDLLEYCISAASILAKVTRDKQMIKLDQQYPQYGFAKHKGYPTKQHLDSLYKYGLISLHRKSFKPIRNIL